MYEKSCENDNAEVRGGARKSGRGGRQAHSNELVERVKRVRKVIEGGATTIKMVRVPSESEAGR